MKTMKFKTSAKCGGCVAKIDAVLEGRLPDGSWSLDLSSPDKILTVEADVSEDEIISLVKSAGFRAERV
ncbi:MAG: heavy metal transport/detoxification protein [Rikenellaceae bacterium]|nr:heavy metal transport/detoxification protein [Rikenellaceae bacterium]